MLPLAVFVAAGACSPTPTATRIPTSTPHPNPTPSGAVSGSIRWEAVDQDTHLNYFALEAESSAADVIEMRRGRDSIECSATGQMGNLDDWEPVRDAVVEEFLPVMHFEARSMYIQYRDAAGNVSPVYCTDMTIVYPTPMYLLEILTATPPPTP
jgi:hypothetical protein